VTLDGSGSDPAAPDGSRVVRYTWTPKPAHSVTRPGLTPGVRAGLRLASGKPFSKSSGPRLRLQAPKSDGEYYVSLTVADGKGRTDTSTTYFVVNHGRARPANMLREHPSWIDSAVIYAPIPQLWGDDGPRSVERRLPYLKKLGVDALWLWPPAERRAFGEEYRIVDYFHLDPSWGPPSAFKHMVDTAHRLGMHVLIDFVPNHTSVKHPYFQDAEEHGKASHYFDFYDRDAQGHVTEYSQIFGTTGLPNLNYDNPEVRRMIAEASLHWIRTYGIDGFRIDAAWGVERRRPTYWTEWRRELKRVDPDLLLLAESSAVDPHIFRGFDLAYDWTNHPGQWAWTSAFEFPLESGALLAPAITNDPKGYAPNALVMRFLNNNDTDTRFVDQYGPDLTKVAATLQFTVPGVPEMFAGDEIGASYLPYSNLTPIPWRDRFNLRPFYERLIRLKHSVTALNTRHIDVLTASPDSCLAYIRPAPAGGGPPVLVLLNFGERTTVSIPRTPALDEAMGASGSMRDLLTGKSVRIHVGPKDVALRTDAESEFVLVPEAR
jgi:cyclomaltodextrinase / maltogenic alpha-amylase / neopullulanase